MKDVSDPERLLSASARGSLLERGLTTARRRGPTDAELSALRASLFGGAAAGGAILERTARAGTRPTTTAGSAGGRALGLMNAAKALVVASAVVGGTTVAWHRTQAIPSERPTRAVSLGEGKAVPKIVPLAPLTPAARTTPVPSERRRSSTVTVSTRPRAMSQIREIAPAASEADEELVLLGKAQRALPKDPELALTFVDDHQRRYPNGLLGQEREAVAVSALWQIGRRDEARQRAERFAEEHPRSTYIGRMRRILSQPGDADPSDKDDDIPPSTVGGPK